MGTKRIGDCRRQCGYCCTLQPWADDQELLERARAVFSTPPFPGLTDEGACKNLMWKDGLAVCADYEHRPDPCRHYPATMIDTLLAPHCGYTLVQIDP